MRPKGINSGTQGLKRAMNRKWQGIADKHGFASEREMFETMAPNTYSSEIAAVCEHWPQTVRKRMDNLGIEYFTKGRGGPRREKKQELGKPEEVGRSPWNEEDHPGCLVNRVAINQFRHHA